MPPKPILTAEQILACLSHDGGREEMLQEAARMGMMKAAAIAEHLATRAGTADEAADAIRAAVEE